MRIAFFSWLLAAAMLAGCGLFPGSGPTADDVAKQARKDGGVLFDVVKVDDRVLATVLAQPQPRFAALFAPPAPPPRLRIAVGDRVAVVVWEAALGGLFTEAPPQFSLQTEPLTAPPTPPTPPAPPTGGRPLLLNPAREAEVTAAELAQAAAEEARQGIRIPDQIVAFDGAISVPFAGRVRAAGRTPVFFRFIRRPHGGVDRPTRQSRRDSRLDAPSRFPISG